MTNEFTKAMGDMYNAYPDIFESMTCLGDLSRSLENLPPSREVSLAKTKLEECGFWLTKSLEARMLNDNE